ncbi:glutaredoxin domain-containing cysteine-rich protein CG31559-like isoform X2 [Lingula anatina]|uniref:Glutaredoxin domain-containing cysteine-rich protein CG31559 n=1 Tax=Lingula anatina TaxID=7574 RepID=A0A1S3KG43_LINAN|nr:glutaredoxin domain-containing cysteine-rich protein CG31559 [Lingula anatina]XP_013421433.1 glutaredoxin domain-containing cysteine-rich protein CG31559-like isoform X1 [Lingula anatina]XP_013421434.1 glutaredoxin domain-containing cysteine-rich protein CG31559-like isoform X2 [Lingula anatina]|eukprot:XP_013417328.1 glutaredoxin domain-containing cysteine-rich protein CG31559 [Lingula anatina]
MSATDKRRRKSPDWLRIFRDTAHCELDQVEDTKSEKKAPVTIIDTIDRTDIVECGRFQNGYAPPVQSKPQNRSPEQKSRKVTKNHHPKPLKDPENGEDSRPHVKNIFNEHFYVNGFADESVEDGKNGKSSIFAGRRDMLNTSALEEHIIVSGKGTVRGFKNRVRAGIVTFLEQQDKNKKNYKVLEKGKIVVYTTTMRIIRDTYEKCQKVRYILQNHMVRFEEKDVFMNRDHQKELIERLGEDEVTVPQVFADGVLLGGVEALDNLNESGELRKIFRHFKKITVNQMCEKCGGYRYVPCSVCHGSKKSTYRNHFTTEFCALRCMQCDENGLVRCDLCLDQQE